MYKNFNLTESEKEQILNMHKEHGYKKPLNEDIEMKSNDMSLDEAIDKLKMFSEQLEEMSQQFYDMFKDTPYWDYVEKMYGGVRSVSDMEMNYTRTDETGENVSRVIEILKSDFGEDSSVENDDMPGFEGTMDSLNDLSIR
jgi:hypothetical protein